MTSRADQDHPTYRVDQELIAATLHRCGQAHLWEDELGIYVNRIPESSAAGKPGGGEGDGFYRHVSPTSLYPMQAGGPGQGPGGTAAGPSDARVARMVAGWLLDRERFCLAPGGDSAGNSDACYWGLPSIEASDAAFPQLGYWRGFVWVSVELQGVRWSRGVKV
jgi:hypothetical protein